MLAHWLANQRQSSYFQGAEGHVAALSDADIALTRRAYYGLIAEIDHWIGAVLTELRRSGAWEHTLVIFTSDHGEQLGDHHLLGKLGWFDQSYHLPLIISDPTRQGGGKVVEAFTEAVDLMPTILDWLGETVPAACDGASLVPWLEGTPPEWRQAVHFRIRSAWRLSGAFSSLPEGIQAEEAGPMAAMRTREWKYVHLTGQAAGQQYEPAARPWRVPQRGERSRLPGNAGRGGSGDAVLADAACRDGLHRPRGPPPAGWWRDNAAMDEDQVRRLHPGRTPSTADRIAMPKALITGITGQDGLIWRSCCWRKAMRFMACCDAPPRRR